jgi:hypothetical protein
MQYHEFDQIQQIVVIKRHVLNQIIYQLGRNFLVRVPLIKNTPFERARKTESTWVEIYGTYTVVLWPYFAVIQVGDLRPYFYRNTARIRSVYSINTAKIRRKYGRKSPAWITEKYGLIRPFTCNVRWRNGRLRLGYVHLRSTVNYHQGASKCLYNCSFEASIIINSFR